MSWFEPRVNLLDGDTDILMCPSCGGGLSFDGRHGTPNRTGKRPLRSGVLRCGCGRAWPMTAGVPRLVDPRSLAGPDRLLRPIYDFIAPSHDLGVDFVLPLLQFPDPGASRERYIRPLELNQLSASGAPRRILEVGIGAGANLPLLQRHLPTDDADEIWGVDLSPGMLLQCGLRAEVLYAERRLRLVMADAHNLPFADASFDRVFHVGGINGYRDISRGLAEMARVAKPGTPIVVVDEELDPKRSHSVLHRLAFNAITWLERNPRVPIDALPHDATDVEVSRVSRFYYCLKFRMPAGAAPRLVRTAPTPVRTAVTPDPRAAVAAARRKARDAARQPRARAARRARMRKERNARYDAAQAALAETAPKRPGRAPKKRVRPAKKTRRSPQ
jgi:SAM-dependent methyltransferase/uncharacterized protein YbaR (Trm112 family)